MKYKTGTLTFALALVVGFGVIRVATSLAAETPVEPPSTLQETTNATVAPALTNAPTPDTWATVRGGVRVVRLTNVEPWRYERVGGAGATNIVFQVAELIEREYIVPVQTVEWWNPVSNIWEKVELTLIPPRLVRETVRTNAP